MVLGLANHWYQWFFNGFSFRDNGFSMVLGLANHWYQWFCNGFWSGNHWYQWFFNGFVVQQPLDPMVFQWFPMVANHWSNDGMVTIHRYGLQYMLNIAQCTCTHLLKGRAHIKWSKNLRISWQSYRYHQYPKYIPSYLEPLLTYADNITELGADLRYFMMLIVRLLLIPTQDLLAL